MLKAIVTEIALDPELRAIIVREVAGELVTKKDLKESEERLERKRTIGLMASMWISIVIGIIVALMKMN